MESSEMPVLYRGSAVPKVKRLVFIMNTKFAVLDERSKLQHASRRRTAALNASRGKSWKLSGKMVSHKSTLSLTGKMTMSTEQLKSKTDYS